MLAAKPAQLEVAETPTVIETVSDVDPVPPDQYIWKVHTPAEIVCAGRFVKPHTVVTPPACDWMEHGVACAPAVGVIDDAVHGAGGVPCRNSGLPAAWLTGAFVAAHARATTAATSAMATIQPARCPRAGARLRWCTFGCASGRVRGSRTPSSHCLSIRRRRRWWTSSVMRPVLGVRNHGPSSRLSSPFSAAQPWNGTSANERTRAPSTP